MAKKARRRKRGAHPSGAVQPNQAPMTPYGIRLEAPSYSTTNRPSQAAKSPRSTTTSVAKIPSATRSPTPKVATGSSTRTRSSDDRRTRVAAPTSSCGLRCTGKLLAQSKTVRNAPANLELNVEVPEQLFIVRGQVFLPDGTPAPGATVRAHDRDVRLAERLGKPVTTDEQGGFEIRYAASEFARAEKGRADLRVTVEMEGREPVSSDILFNAAADTSVDLTLQWNAEDLSEVERLVQTLEAPAEGTGRERTGPADRRPGREGRRFPGPGHGGPAPADRLAGSCREACAGRECNAGRIAEQKGSETKGAGFAHPRRSFLWLVPARLPHRGSRNSGRCPRTSCWPGSGTRSSSTSCRRGSSVSSTVLHTQSTGTGGSKRSARLFRVSSRPSAICSPPAPRRPVRMTRGPSPPRFPSSGPRTRNWWIASRISRGSKAIQSRLRARSGWVR